VKYFYDAEFFEDGKTIDLISIGMVCEDGREFYAVNQDAQLHLVSPWVREHVLPQLPHYGDKAWMSRSEIRDELMMFTGGHPAGYPKDVPLDKIVHTFHDSDNRSHVRQPRFQYKLDGPDALMQLWAFYADYDHICMCQLFGTMMKLPEHFPKYTMDLKQLSVSVGSPKHPPQTKGLHNALDDARWNRDLYKFLVEHGQSVGNHITR
jgi:hypothetical protein